MEIDGANEYKDRSVILPGEFDKIRYSQDAKKDESVNNVL